jgi:EGF-like domain
MKTLYACALVSLAVLLLGCSSDPSGVAGPDGSAASGGGGGTSAGGSGASSGTGAVSGTGGAVDASSDGVTSSCSGVTCSGHGTCSESVGSATCQCDPGYHPAGLDCQADQTCAGVDCGLCGTCDVLNGTAICSCPTGYGLQAGKCVLDPDPCVTTSCGADEACVSEAHCQPLGACVPTCDCNNCGNCGPDNADGRWDDMQEYCGNLMSSPATLTCTKPCPAGQGCIPYSPAICWPLEGCFSL